MGYVVHNETVFNRIYSVPLPAAWVEIEKVMDDINKDFPDTLTADDSVMVTAQEDFVIFTVQVSRSVEKA